MVVNENCGYNMASYSMKRLLVNPVLYSAIVITCLLVFIPASRDINLDYEGLDVVYLFRYTYDIGSFSRMLPLLAAVTTASGFVQDYNSKMLNMLLARMNTFQYTISKYIVCLCGGFLTMFCGWSLYVALLSVRYPIALADASNFSVFCSELYGVFLYRGHPYLFILPYILGSSICGGFWAVTGLTFSTYIPNKLIATAFPFFLNEALYDLTNIASLKWYSPSNVAKGIPIGGNLTSFICLLSYFIFLIVGVYWLFHVGVRRRVCLV